MPEEEVVTLEEAGVVAENIDTTVETVTEVVGEVVSETPSETVSDENVAIAEEVVETVEEVA